MPSNIEKIQCQVIRETGGAYLLQDHQDPERQDYFPKSQVSFTRRNINTGEAIAEIPLWLLDAKGWNS